MVFKNNPHGGGDSCCQKLVATGMDGQVGLYARRALKQRPPYYDLVTHLDPPISTDSVMGFEPVSGRVWMWNTVTTEVVSTLRDYSDRQVEWAAGVLPIGNGTVRGRLMRFYPDEDNPANSRILIYWSPSTITEGMWTLFDYAGVVIREMAAATFHLSFTSTLIPLDYDLASDSVYHIEQTRILKNGVLWKDTVTQAFRKNVMVVPKGDGTHLIILHRLRGGAVNPNASQFWSLDSEDPGADPVLYHDFDDQGLPGTMLSGIFHAQTRRFVWYRDIVTAGDWYEGISEDCSDIRNLGFAVGARFNIEFSR